MNTNVKKIFKKTVSNVFKDIGWGVIDLLKKKNRFNFSEI